MTDSELSMLAVSSEPFRSIDRLFVDAGSDHDSPDLHQDPTLRQRTFAENNCFVAAVSLGQIVRGHTLIVPREFAWSVRDYTRRRDATPELLAILGDVRTRLTEYTGVHCTILFEHAMEGPCNTGSRCGTIYPHLHVVPTELSVAETFDAPCLYRRVYQSISEYIKDLLPPDEHVYYEDRNVCVAAIPSVRMRRYFGSQTVRSAIQDKLGARIVDWKERPETREAIRVAKEIRKINLKLEE